MNYAKRLNAEQSALSAKCELGRMGEIAMGDDETAIGCSGQCIMLSQMLHRLAALE